jgi:spermidine synthase
VSTRSKALISVFCLGVFATLAQVVLMREILVAFFGNELTIGIILASWLVGISLGAFVARFLMKPISGMIQKQWLLACLLVVAAIAFPAQVYFARIARILLHVPAGEYAPFTAIVISSFLVCLPSSFTIGLFFPFACAVASDGTDGQTVSPVYTLESLGSMVGGILLTYLLLPFLTPYRIVLVGGTALLAGAAVLIPGRASRAVLLFTAIGTIALTALYPPWLSSLENRSIVARWRAFGMLSSAAHTGGSPSVNLVQSQDTIYQNLAITESEGQFVLYGNGQVMSVFPDPIGYEHSIHFVMAQNPDARKVLLLGGNPVGDIPELLKYKIKRLVYVELDPGVGRIIRRVMPERFNKVLADPRVKYVSQDAPRFVRNCKETFDVILINAPEPATVGANRFYTREFYINIRRILSNYGFVYTAVTSSERLQSEAMNLGASVYQTLTSVFPVVLVTAEARNRFFACRHRDVLTFDRDTLAGQSRSAGLTNEFFKSEYFSWVDAIDKDKLLDTKERFSNAKVPPNTSIRPVTCFYNLILWNRYSGSKMSPLLDSISSWDKMIRWFVVFAACCLIIGALIKLASLVSKRGTRGRFSRVMVGIVLGTTGLCGMAFEILLIFVFQSMYGYVYTRIGLIVAVFMAGLVLGAPSGKSMIKGGRYSSWLAMAGIEIIFLALALALPFITGFLSLPGMDELSARVSEFLIYAAVGIVGWAVGAEFTVANKLFCDAGGEMAGSAAATDAWDHIGAALGALLMGVILIPVFGIATSCMILAALKAASLLLLAAALLTMPGE